MSAVKEMCAIGKFLNNTCSEIDNPVYLSQFDSETLNNLNLRLNSSFCGSVSEYICNRHKHKFIDSYTAERKKCCDPNEIHKNAVRGDLRIITLNLSNEYYKEAKKRLIPGNKLCKRCEQKIKECLAETNEKKDTRNDSQRPVRIVPASVDASASLVKGMSNLESYPSNSSQGSEGSEFLTCSQGRTTLKNVCQELRMPDLDLSRVSLPRREKLAVDFLTDVQTRLIRQIKDAFDLDLNSSITPVTDSCIQDSVSLNEFLTALQARFESSTSISDKISLLAVIPKHWSFELCRKYFKCTSYMFNKVRKLQKIGKFFLIRIS